MHRKVHTQKEIQPPESCLTVLSYINQTERERERKRETAYKHRTIDLEVCVGHFIREGVEYWEKRQGKQYKGALWAVLSPSLK